MFANTVYSLALLGGVIVAKSPPEPTAVRRPTGPMIATAAVVSPIAQGCSMAGDWIPIRVDIDDDPSVIAMARKLGIDEKTVVGGLVKFWGWASRHTRDGNAPSVTELWIDRYMNCAGWCAAMVEAGWLERVGGQNWLDGGGFSIPNFDRWNSQTAKARALARNRANKHRQQKSNAPSVTRALPQNRTEQNITIKKKPPTPLPEKTKAADLQSGDPHGPDLTIAEQTERAIRLGIGSSHPTESDPCPLEAAMARSAGGNPARIGGAMRRKVCEAANEFGEERVIAALDWATAQGKPYGIALSLARRKSWHEADAAAGPVAKPDGNYERNLKIVREVAEREAAEAAAREAGVGQ